MDDASPDTLRETEIRPDHLMEAQAEAFAADIRWLQQRTDGFIHVPCPACGNDVPETAFEKYELAYVVCRSCETMYVDPRPTPEILEEYYETSENYRFWNDHIFPASEDARREKIFRPRVDRVSEICKRHNVDRGILLEVGAGFGTFCEEAVDRKLFDRVIAVEPTPALAETCRRRGLEVIEKPIEQVKLPGDTVDVVASFEVLEHLFSPYEFMQGCASILAPGGLLVLTCPNVKGFDIVVLGEESGSVDIEHLNYFHPASLADLARRCGFEPLEVLTPGKLDAEIVRKKALAGEMDLSAQPFLKQILINEWERVGDAFQQFLADHELSSHMWLVARKRP